MKYEEVIAVLTKENMELKEDLGECFKVANDIESRLMCVGGPLNDNVYKFSEEQLNLFRRIQEINHTILHLDRKIK